MSLKPTPIGPVPELTAYVARAAFPDGNPYTAVRDALGTFYDDERFAALFPDRGQPAEAPWRLALVTVLQFAEGLSDRQAAEAVRGRIDWKYALGLELTDSGWDAAGRVEGGERVMRIGSPVAAGLRDFDEAGAEGERRVAGGVGDGEHLVAEGGDKEQVDGAHEGGHLKCYPATEAVGLDEVHGGEIAGLAEGVGPGIGLLTGELAKAAGEGELFKAGGGLGEEDDLERAVGPVGKGELDGRHAETADSVKGGAVDVGGGSFAHPAREVADAQTADGSSGVEVEG
jgi:transposase